MHLLIALLVLGQTQVTIDEETQKELGLKPSVENTYMVYTFDEYKEVLKSMAELNALRLKVPLLQKQIDVHKIQVELKREIIQSKDTAITTLMARGERLTTKYERCLDDRAKLEGGSLWPWLGMGAAIAVSLATSIAATYYISKSR